MKSGYYDWSSVSSSSTQQEEAKKFFDENGYVILTSFCKSSETQSLRDRAGEILTEFYNSPASPSTIFTTKDQDRKLDDSFFLSSAGNISCFLEERQQGGKTPAVNKIGHALHDLDDVFRPFSRQDKVRQVADMLGVHNPVLVQSMYILKNAFVGGEVRAHRDATFVRGKDGKCVGYWWALQDATQLNGCLWAVPGSHRAKGTRRRFIMANGATRFEGDMDAEEGFDEKYVAIPVNSGDLVMLDGEVVHKSAENLSATSRHAYSIHVVSDDVPADCWLQRSADFPFQAL